MKNPGLSLLRRLTGLAALGLMLATGPADEAFAGTSVDLCETLAEQVSASAGLPQGLLRSVARMESGRSTGKGGARAWPWTLNQAGKGMYFQTKEEALAYLEKAVKNGVKNIDVGCMQINYRWHGSQFSSLADMIDPVQNVKYGARYLNELKTQHGTWTEAVKHYHSADDKRGDWYYAKVARIWKGVTDAPIATAAADGVNLAMQTASVIAIDTVQEGAAYYEQLAALLPESALPAFEASRVAESAQHEVPATVRKQWDKVKAFRQELAAGISDG